MMEDCSMVAADCVVISCCCQCLILQITIFILFQLPCKLIRKARDYTMKKLQQRQRKEMVVESSQREIVLYPHRDDFVGIGGESIRSTEGGHSFRCCMEEVDKVLHELAQKGEFGFGSFWGRGGEMGGSPKHDQHQFDASFVQFQFIEMIGSVSYRSLVVDIDNAASC